MNAAQRKHDHDLANSLRTSARFVRNRSARIHTVLLLAADRIDALSTELAQYEATKSPAENQPASAPAPN